MDFRALFCDFIFCFFLSSILSFASKKIYKVLSFMALFVVFVVIYANYENISVFDYTFRIRMALPFLMDPVFLKGSILNISNWWLFFVMLFTCLPLWFLSQKHAGQLFYKFSLISTLTSFFLLIVFSLIPSDLSIQSWRQYNLFQENLVQDLKPDSKRKFSEKLPLEYEEFYKDQLFPKKRMPLNIERPKKPTNVLLIFLESVGAVFFPSHVQKTFKNKNLLLKKSDAFLSKYLVYPRFISPRRGTRRAMVSSLCGDYPNVLQRGSKMKRYGLFSNNPQKCLPEVLNKKGYNTAYLQADPLAFNAKDTFLKAVKFKEFNGKSYFKKAYSMSNWGPDDKTFFEATLERIEDLNKKPEPWFLTAITIGTHHPVNVPESFKSSFEKDSLAISIEYLDQALLGFLNTLKKRGYFDNTLIIITADESYGLKTDDMQLKNQMSQFWLPLFVISPNGDSKINKEAYYYGDLPVSILDYLSMDQERDSFSGRSLFRNPSQNRFLFFGLERKIALFDPQNFKLIWCSRDFYSCNDYPLQNKNLFWPLKSSRPANQKYIDYLDAFLSFNDRTNTNWDKKQSFSLIKRNEVLVKSFDYRQDIFGQQYLDIPQNKKISVQVEIEVMEGKLELLHDFSTHVGSIIHFSTDYKTYKKGQFLKAKYSVDSKSIFWDTEIRLYAKNFSGKTAKLKFHKAEVLVQNND